MNLNIKFPVKIVLHGGPFDGKSLTVDDGTALVSLQTEKTQGTTSRHADYVPSGPPAPDGIQQFVYAGQGFSKSTPEGHP